MCGIVGYIGSNFAEIVVVDGLKRLEYRGYDSAGLATPLGGVPWLEPIMLVLPLQMLPYHTAVLKGCDVDQPRNLA
jgi:glucosamine 6-phosphate synthetase-like amidotransferase/phosphosugar isomerase protein